MKELDAVGWVIRLAKRLEALHADGVAHGKISPACVRMSGAQRTAEGRLSRGRALSGDRAFQSPERIQGGPPSPADDTWAAAAVLYTAVTGRAPFAGASGDDVRQKVIAASPAPLADFDVADDDLQHILDAAFAKDAGKRTVSAAVLRKALEEWHPDPVVGSLQPLEEEEPAGDTTDPAAAEPEASEHAAPPAQPNVAVVEAPVRHRDSPPPRAPAVVARAAATPSLPVLGAPRVAPSISVPAPDSGGSFFAAVLIALVVVAAVTFVVLR